GPGGGATEGAGLGLSIAKWIAAEHRAETFVSSRPGLGCEVRVEFPPGANGVLDRGHSGARLGVEGSADRSKSVSDVGHPTSDQAWQRGGPRPVWFHTPRGPSSRS